MRFLYPGRRSAVDFLCGSGPISRIMKSTFRHLGGPAERAVPLDAHRDDPPSVAQFPRPGEVLNEIGLILAIHLALALAVTVSLQAIGID